MKVKIKRTQIFMVLGIIALCTIAFGAGYWLSGKSKSQDEELLVSAYRTIVSDSLFNQNSSRELSYTAIRGMLNVLDDHYAELIEPQAAKNFTTTFSGQTGVVGLYAENKAGQVVISIVYAQGPANNAGLRVGDVILAIDHVTLDKNTSASETGLMLRGLPGTTVHLKIRREQQELEFDVTRQVREYVSSRMLPEGVGYISLNAFNSTASQKMKETLEALQAQKPVGLVWDLRGNEGGDMQAAQEILSYFIKDGVLFSAELTQNRSVKFLAKGNAIAAEIPLVVLMDKTTYSAGETCAATVAERGRGKTVGSTSYGKGVIQATISLPGDALLQMTVAKWLTPNGEWVQGRGVSPQIEASDDPATEADELLQAAVKLITQK